jgi:triphosphatase
MVVKLNFDLLPEELARLRRTDPVRRLTQEKSTTSFVHCLHFDTPDLALRKRGIVLVLRRDHGSWIQDIQRTGMSGQEAGLRHEWSLPRPDLDLSLLKATAYRGLLKKKHLRREIGPLFSIRLRHTVTQLALGEDCKAKLHTIAGKIIAGSRERPVCQARMELESGDPTRLFALALDILRSIPMRLSYLSIEERAYLLLSGKPEKPRKAARIELDGKMSRLHSERLIAANCMTQIQSNESGFLDAADPEYLHQLRVGWRRLRSAASMPESALWNDLPKLLRAELRWIWDALGTARNWDVLVEEILPGVTRASATNRHRAQVFAGLLSQCDRIRKRHVDRARSAIRSSRYQRLLLNIAWIVMDSHSAADPNDELAPIYSAKEFARDVLIQRRRKLKKRLNRTSLATAAERHRARIAAKKLRYACDFFHEVFPEKAARKFLGSLESLQDALGRLNDLVTCTTLIGEATASSEAPIGRLTRELINDWVRAEEAKALIGLERARLRFSSRPSFWLPEGEMAPDQSPAFGTSLLDRESTTVTATLSQSTLRGRADRQAPTARLTYSSRRAAD